MGVRFHRGLRSAAGLLMAFALVLTGAIGSPRTTAQAAGTLTGRSDFLWGMNLHNRGYAAYPERNLGEHMRLSAEMGAKIVRFGLDPGTNVENYAYIDKALAYCEAYGMEMLFGMAGYNTDPKIWEVIASRYKGRIKYYNVLNETDVYCMDGSPGTILGDGSGRTQADYNMEKVKQCGDLVKRSVEAIRSKDPSAKIVLNFSWTHTWMVDYYAKTCGIDWDIIGWDWYSNMEENRPYAPGGIVGLLDELQAAYPKHEFLICEANFWTYKPNYSEDEQADYNAQFATTVYEYALKNPRVKGLIFYELLDEMAYQPAGSQWEGEAHFGFVHCDAQGNIGRKKVTFDVLQELIGGKSMPVIDLSKTTTTAPVVTTAPTTAKTTVAKTTTAPAAGTTEPGPASSTGTTASETTAASSADSTDTTVSTETITTVSDEDAIAPPDDPDGGSWWWVLIGIGGALLVGAGVFLLVWFKIPQKWLSRMQKGGQ